MSEKVKFLVEVDYNKATSVMRHVVGIGGTVTEYKPEISFTGSQVVQIVDYCFHKHASQHRGKDAAIAITEAIEIIARAEGK